MDGIVTQGLTASIGRFLRIAHELLQERLSAKDLDVAGFGRTASGDMYAVSDVMWGSDMVDICCSTSSTSVTSGLDSRWCATCTAMPVKCESPT